MSPCCSSVVTRSWNVLASTFIRLSSTLCGHLPLGRLAKFPHQPQAVGMERVVRHVARRHEQHPPRLVEHQLHRPLHRFDVIWGDS